MAAGPASVGNYGSALLKDDYSVGLKNALNNNNVIWGEVARNTEDIVGLQAVWSVHSGRSGASGTRGELATLPTADRQRFTRAADTLAYVYHTVKVSGPAMALTKNDTGAFGRAVEIEARGCEMDLKRDMNRQAFGQKVLANSVLVSGVIATLSTDPGTGTTLTFASEPSSVIRHFHSGMYLCIVNPSDGAVRAGGPYEVTGQSVANKTVTTGSAINAAAASGDYVVRCDSASTANNNLNSEVNGLRFLIGTGDYAGITAANVPAWNSVTLGSSTTSISEEILDEAVEKVETDGNGSSPGIYIAEHAQRRKLAQLLQTKKQYDGREVTLTSGWKGLNVARGTLVVDRFCPSTKVFALNMPDIELFVGLDFQWDEDDDGGVWFKTRDQDAIEARYKAYLNLEAVVRNSHSVTTLAEPTF